MEFVIFSNKQGSGYISDIEIDNYINQISVSINNQIITPGQSTNLFNHFCRDLKYIGLNKKEETEMIFFIGSTNDLFNKEFYYQSVFKISENRIFELYGQGSGRDFFFINGKWK